MPGKQKKNPNPLREIRGMIDRLSGKYGTRAKEEKYAKEIESDPFFQAIQRLEAGERQAASKQPPSKQPPSKQSKIKPSKKIDILDKIRKKKKKNLDKPSNEALKEGLGEFFKDVD